MAVRDDGSAAAVPGVATETTGDDALLLTPPDQEVVAAALRDAGVSGRFLAITVREAAYVGAGSDDLAAWAEAVDELASARDLTVVGVALNEQPGQTEVASLARLANGGIVRRSPWRIVECGRDPHLLAGVMATAAAAVAHSYHAALFALASSVPAVLMSHSPYYEQKADGLAALAGLPDAFAVRAGDDLALGDRLDLVAKALASGAGLDPATAAVRTWWSATIAALVATPRGGTAR